MAPDKTVEASDVTSLEEQEPPRTVESSATAPVDESEPSARASSNSPQRRDGDETSDGGEDQPELLNGDASVAPAVHEGREGWTAVWDPTHNAYYFFNSDTNETTWTNPFEASTAATEPGLSAAAETQAADSGPDYGGIDPDLAYLDPNLKRTAGGTNTPAFQARFNARTGRFQADPSMNPDRISEYNRGLRQQEVFYNVDHWTESLQGKGIKRSAETESGPKKKPTAKQVEAFKLRKEMRKKAKLLDSMK